MALWTLFDFLRPDVDSVGNTLTTTWPVISSWSADSLEQFEVLHDAFDFDFLLAGEGSIALFIKQSSSFSIFKHGASTFKFTWAIITLKSTTLVSHCSKDHVLRHSKFLWYRLLGNSPWSPCNSMIQGKWRGIIMYCNLI